MNTMEHVAFERILTLRNKDFLQSQRVYLVSDRHRFPQDQAGELAFMDQVASCIDAGVRLVMLKEDRRIPDAKVLSLAKQLRSLTQEYGAKLIIAERCDIARVSQADGVHLGPADMTPTEVRQVLGPEYIVGVSIHAAAQLEKLSLSEVDYLTVGPVFASELLPGQPPVGLSLVERVGKQVQLPCFAAGGITFDNLDELITHGITHIALTRGLMNAALPKEAVCQLLTRLSKEPEAKA